MDLSTTSTKSLFVSFEFKDIATEIRTSGYKHSPTHSPTHSLIHSPSGTSSLFNERTEFRLKIKNNKPLKRKAEASSITNNSKEIHINIRKRGDTNEAVVSDTEACPTKWFVMKRSIKGLKKKG